MRFNWIFCVVLWTICDLCVHIFCHQQQTQHDQFFPLLFSVLTGQILSCNGTVSISRVCARFKSRIEFYPLNYTCHIKYIGVQSNLSICSFFYAVKKFSISALENDAVLHIDWMRALCPFIFDVVECAAWRFVPCIHTTHTFMHFAQFLEMISHNFFFDFGFMQLHIHFFQKRSIFSSVSVEKNIYVK